MSLKKCDQYTFILYSCVIIITAPTRVLFTWRYRKSRPQINLHYYGWHQRLSSHSSMLMTRIIYRVSSSPCQYIFFYVKFKNILILLFYKMKYIIIVYYLFDNLIFRVFLILNIIILCLFSSWYLSFIFLQL